MDFDQRLNDIVCFLLWGLVYSWCFEHQPFVRESNLETSVVHMSVVSAILNLQKNCLFLKWTVTECFEIFMSMNCKYFFKWCTRRCRKNPYPYHRWHWKFTPSPTPSWLRSLGVFWFRMCVKSTVNHVMCTQTQIFQHSLSWIQTCKEAGYCASTNQGPYRKCKQNVVCYLNPI